MGRPRITADWSRPMPDLGWQHKGRQGMNMTADRTVNNPLARNWWLIALRGVLAIVFGLLAFFMPGLALLSLVLLFGAYALVDGVIAIVSGLWHHKENSRWWVLVLEGIAGVVAGII